LHNREFRSEQIKKKEYRSHKRARGG
jgi:hypothetical protein